MSERFLTKPAVVAVATIQVTEAEMRALEAMVGYGADSFMRVFYEHLGKHYMTPHEAGMRSFMASVRDEIPTILRRIDAARAAFNPKPVATPKGGE